MDGMRRYSDVEAQAAIFIAALNVFMGCEVAALSTETTRAVFQYVELNNKGSMT